MKTHRAELQTTIVQSVTRVFLSLVLAIVVTTRAHALSPVHSWSGGFGDLYWDHGRTVAVDPWGNVLVAGSFIGTVNFGGANLTSAGDRDVFLAKFNSTGVHQWSKRFGGTDYDEVNGLTVDFAGNIVITGRFSGSASFGGSNLVSAGQADIFIAKYTATGLHHWSKRFGSTGWDEGATLVTNYMGYVIVAGVFEGNVNFGGSWALTSAGSQDIFIAQYTDIGNHSWSRSYGSFATDRPVAIALDIDGHLVVTGRFGGTVDFGGGPLTSSSYDIFVAKYLGAYTHAWSKRFGGNSDDGGTAIVVDGSDVIVAGTFKTGVDFGGGMLWDTGGGDVFLARFDADGSHRWSRGLGGSGPDEATSVACAASDGIVLTGYFYDAADFGGGALVSAGITDVFLAKFTSAGAHRWSTRFGGGGYDYGLATAVDATGSVLLTGMFQGTMSVGGDDLPSAGSSDIFLARYGPEPAAPVIYSIADLANDQGRRVKICFNRSGLDVIDSATPVTSYEIYRRDDAAPASFAVGAHARGLLADGWTFVGSVPAHAEPSYGFDAPTIGDSTIALGDYRSVFYVRAATVDAGVFFDSPADSGYSLDNIAPGVPGGLMHSTSMLAWNKSSAEDFDYFTVYGSNTDSFASATVVDYCVEPEMDINAAGYAYYFITATDFSGNEGSPAVINTLTGVGGTPKSYVLSISAYPNPFNPATTIRYTIPSRGRVTVAVYDARGALVVTLVNEDTDTGAHTERWDGSDPAGRVVSSGVYFARVSHSSGTRSYKLVLLK